MLDKEKVKEIRNYCEKKNISIFSFFMSIYSIYLSRTNRLNEFVIGTPILNRSSIKEKQTMGMFINTIPIKITMPEKDIEFTEFVRLFSTKMISFLKHQKYSYTQILEDLRKEKPKTSTLYNVLISYQITKAFQKEIGDYTTEWVFNGYTSNDIDIHITDFNDTGKLSINYDFLIDRYEEKDIDNINSRIVHIIEQILQKEKIYINKVDIITKNERQKLLYTINDTNEEYPKDKTIIELFEKQVEKTPNEIAITFKDKNLTYKQLNEKANSLAYYLRNKENIGRDNLVGIMVNRSLEMIVAIIAVLKAGGAYIPIDPTYPKERIDYMLSSSSSKILLTQKELEGYVEFNQKLFIDLENEEIYNLPCQNLKIISKPEDLAYVIFTSGSTGKPKGVMLKQQNIVNFIFGMMKEFKFNQGDTIVSVTTISFDIFVLESLMPLLNGLKIVIASEEEQVNSDLFNKLCINNNVEIIQTTPSRIQAFISDKQNIEFIKKAKYILIGGEPFPKSLLTELKTITNSKIYNMYGPTETAVWSTLKELTNTDFITIGKPIINTQIYNLDPHLNLQPIGTPGELYIAGDGLSRGYLNNIDLTDKSFIKNPFIPNSLMYKTGDLGICTEDGEIICLGRSDNQVKIRGLRIELEEIEDKIKELSFINTCAVAKKSDENEHEHICAYFTASSKINTKEIYDYLVKYLPKYMIPQYFIQLEEIPHTPNGKIDRKSLPQPNYRDENKEIILPRNEIDLKLVKILQELIKVEKISIDDNFFDIGGDSLSAINLCSQVQSEFNMQLLVKDIIEHPQIQDLSDLIKSNKNTLESQVIRIIPKSEYYPVSSAQKRIYYVSKTTNDELPLYNISGGVILEGDIDTEKLEKCFKTIINRHESLRTFFVMKNEEVVQKILEEVEYKLDIVENANYDNIETIFKDFVKPFDLSKAPLFRTRFIKFTNKKSLLLIDIHHIISDGTSLSILSEELCKLYDKQQLPKLKIAYKDFAAFEGKRLLSGELKEAEDYWLSQFDGEIPVLNIPTTYVRPNVQDFKGKKVYKEIDSITTNKIKNISKSLNITPYMFLLSAYYILLSKYSNQDDIIIGSPVIGRDIKDTYNLIGMFVNSLALREKIDSRLSFKEFVESLKKHMLQRYKYQTYPFDELVDKLNIKKEPNRNPLFDTMFIYQNNGYGKFNFKNIKTQNYMPDMGISKMDLSLEIIPEKDNMKLSFEYATQLFEEDYIKSLATHYLNIVEDILKDVDKRISEIKMLSEDEENQILYEFNDTKIDYPKNKTIIKLFEENVKKYPNNTAIVCDGQKLTYKQLNEKANSLAYYLRNISKVKRNDLVGIMLNRSVEILICIIGILKAGGAYVPIDPTYPKDRIKYMLDNSNAKVLLTQQEISNNIEFKNKLIVDIDKSTIYSRPNTNLKIINTPDDLSYVIFTSGSTGLPKGVMIKQSNVMNLQVAIKELFGFSEKNSIAALATMSFDMFVLESLISTLLGIKIVLANNNEQINIKLFNQMCIKNNVDILETTPSRVKSFMLSTKDTEFIKNAKYLLIGGEAFQENLLSMLYEKTDAQIYNMYGPTETTVWSAAKKIEKNDVITIGKPLANTQIYILDNNLKPVPIGISGEIYISGDGVGKGYLTSEELTQKSFMPNPFVPGTMMYKTGDVGILTKNGEIICQGRLDNQVKIRGLRIELGDIEDKINKIEGIESCAVIKKADENLHEFLCAFYTAHKDIDGKTLSKNLEDILPKYMIPQVFIKLEKMPYTNTGKIDRKKLPEPKYSNKKEIVEPRNEIDEKIIEILKRLLSINTISIDDSFFDIGGDSLSAINLCAEVQDEFNMELYVKDILEHQTIQDLSDYICQNLNTLEESIIHHIPKAEFYPTSSAQKRMYFVSQMAGPESVLYNIAGGVILEGNVDTKKIADCLNTLVNRHESLRTCFELNNENLVQKIIEKVEFQPEIIENCEYENLDKIFKEFIKPFDLSVAPLFRAKIVKLTNNKSAIFLDMHHIISDGTSLSILSDELCKLYNGEKLSELKITYKDFAVFENDRLNSGKLKEAENYWISQFKEDLPVLNMPTTYPRPSIQNFEGKRLHEVIDEKTTQRIKEIAKELDITPYMLLLSAYYILISKYSKQEDIVIGSPIVGRNNKETYNIIGMFVNSLALREVVNRKESFKEFSSSLKLHMLERYKYQTYPFEELVNNLDIQKDPSRNPIFDIMFIYQNNGYGKFHFKDIETHNYIPDMGISKMDLSLEIIPDEGKLSIYFEYATKLFGEKFIKRLSQHYLNILEEILSNPNIKIEDINKLSEEEEKQIIYEFNNTQVDYQVDKTIVDLFEEQVNKNPNNVAIVFENQELTYKELNERANSIAHYLRDTIKIKRNELIGIMVNRSAEIMVCIMGIIKAGGAYVPIDPKYPKDRIEYMLKSSKIKVLLTQEILKNKIEFNNKVCIDLNTSKIYSYKQENLFNINKPEDLAYVIFTSGSTGLPKGVMIKHSNIANLHIAIKKFLGFSEQNTIAALATISFDMFVLESLISMLIGMKIVIASDDEQTNIKMFNEMCVKNNVDIIETTPSRVQSFLLSENDRDFIKNAKTFLIGGENFPSNLLEKLQQITNAQIYNMYGPTETTVWSSGKKLSNDEEITIGKPLANTQIYILDENLKPVPIGISGEIYISGDGVGKGYLTSKDLTDKNFIPNPFVPGTKMYKTGDIGLLTESGEIICLGRADNQIKIRGLRVELGEIESKLLQYPNINKATVIKQTVNDREFISAYYLASKRIIIDELRKYLLASLPRYMVPTYYIPVDDFPYTPTGKIDKKALPLPEQIMQVYKEEYVAPKTKIQKQLVSMWEKILNTKPIGINDNFFELGGDSLLAMNLHIEILKISEKITYQDIFRYPTVSELEEKINSDDNKPLFSKIENIAGNCEEILKKNNKRKRTKKYKNNNVLLTGATGFLGIHILEELIKTQTGNIYCIVRQEPGITAVAKLSQKLNYYFGNKYNDLIGKRIFVIQGDITKPAFGLNQEEILKLAGNIEIIINSAANVSHYGNYNDFYKINVMSVKHITDFCNSFNKKLYHISTMSVSGTKLDLSYPLVKYNKINFDETCLYVGQILDNVYMRSKFEAESYIINAISKGTDAYILRMGNLMPRNKDGIFQENIADNAFINRVISFIKIGALPESLLNESIEITPVDIASKAVVKITTHSNNVNRIFHIYNKKCVSIKRMLKALKKLDYNIEIIDEEQFKNKIDQMLRDERAQKLLKNLLNDFNKDLQLDYNTDIILRSEFTVKYLRKLLFKWPRISDEYLVRFFQLLKKVM